MTNLSKLSASLLMLTLFFAGNLLRAQSPNALNYQAVARNSSGNTLVNQPVGLRFTIHSDSLTGNVAFRETHSVTTTPQGIFTVVIGGGNIIVGNIEQLHWATSAYFLQVEMDATGGTTYTDMGTSRLISVPYALYANSAGSLALNTSTFHTITGNDSLIVGAGSSIVVPSSVVPANAVMTISPGVYQGQVLYVIGQGSGTNGIRFENNSSIDVGSSGGPVDVVNGSVISFIWMGNKWLKVAYSSNQ